MAHKAYNHPEYRAYKERLRTAAILGERIECVIPLRDGLPLDKCLKIALQPNHIVPVHQGGRWTADNLEPACSQCNHTLNAMNTNQQKKDKRIARDY